jgi:hypothetical protein
MQDSQNAGTKAVGEMQKTLQCLGGQFGSSLFGALVLVAATLAMYWPANEVAAQTHRRQGLCQDAKSARE